MTIKVRAEAVREGDTIVMNGLDDGVLRFAVLASEGPIEGRRGPVQRLLVQRVEPKGMAEDWFPELHTTVEVERPEAPVTFEDLDDLADAVAGLEAELRRLALRVGGK